MTPKLELELEQIKAERLQLQAELDELDEDSDPDLILHLEERLHEVERKLAEYRASLLFRGEPN